MYPIGVTSLAMSITAFVLGLLASYLVGWLGSWAWTIGVLAVIFLPVFIFAHVMAEVIFHWSDRDYPLPPP